MGLTLKYDIQCFLGLNSIVTRQSDVTSCFVFGPEVHGKKKKKKKSSIFRIFTSSPSQNTFVLISLVDSIKNGKEDTVYQE